MKSRNETENLIETIAILKRKQAEEFLELNQQFHIVYESVKPMNLIKNTFNEMVNTPEIRHNFLNNAIGLSTGYLSKKIMLGSSHSPVKKVIGTVVQFLITNFVSKHSDNITSKL
ncbi:MULTISPECIES: hypothetical protein [unclassified Flavobacterium]|uniref:hypothetical protein n=1 Tax=unclassified Flavobacterium TaxID=196869 RepID=UPI003F8FA272